MSATSSDGIVSTAPENLVRPNADEKAELKRERLQLTAEREAFELDKKDEWAMIEREKKCLDEKKAEASRLKEQLVSGISEYFFRKAELEGGLVSASKAPDDRSLPSPPRHQLADNAKGAEQPSEIPLRTKRGTLGLQEILVPQSPDWHGDTANSRSPSPHSLAQFADDEDDREEQPMPPPKGKLQKPRTSTNSAPKWTSRNKGASNERSRAPFSSAHSADDKEDQEGRLALPLPKIKRGRPRKNHVPQVKTQDETSSELPARQVKKRGRRKIYHQTAYGTRLPLIYLLFNGRTKVADQIQAEDPRGWGDVIRFIKDRQLVAPLRFRAWVEKRSKDCMASFFDLRRRKKWPSGLEKLRACNDCQISKTPCIILDPTGTKMILLPRPDEP